MVHVLHYGPTSVPNFGFSTALVPKSFQALLVWLAEEGHIIGVLASKKLRAFKLTEPTTHIRRHLRRPRRSILFDVFSGFQSLAYLVIALSPTYISADISAVLVAGTSTFSATLVQGLSLLSHGQIIQCIPEALGISAGCIALLWCSPPCRTFSFPMPSMLLSPRSARYPAVSTAVRITLAQGQSIQKWPLHGFSYHARPACLQPFQVFALLWTTVDC